MCEGEGLIMAVSNSLVEQEKKPKFSTFLTSTLVKQKINEVVGGKDGQRFMTQILSAVTNNPALAECDPMTILNCAFLGEALKLSPSPQLGHYYMIPFENKKTGITKAQFIPGYKGLIQLAIRTGQYKKLNVLAIKEGEFIRYDPMNEEIEVNLMDSELERENTPTVGYYAMFELGNGFRKALYWTREKMEIHADKYSSAFSSAKAQLIKDGKMPQSEMWKYSSYWYKDFDGMAYKTMLRQLISKWGIMSIEMLTAMESDSGIPDSQGKFNYPDNDFDMTPTPTPTIDVTPEVVEEDDDDVPDFLKGVS